MKEEYKLIVDSWNHVVKHLLNDQRIISKSDVTTAAYIRRVEQPTSINRQHRQTVQTEIAGRRGSPFTNH